MALPIALQLYSVRDFMEKDFEGTLKKVKEMGYEGVEFAGLYDRDPHEIRALLDEIGLTAISAHVAADTLLADLDGQLAAYQTLGCRFIALPWSAEEYRPGAAKFPVLIEQAKTIGAAAKKYGITLLYHNHDFEFVPLNGKPGLDVLYEEVPADLLETELDTCWVQVAGQDPASYVRKYTGRAPVVHLKDFLLAGQKPKQMYELIGVEQKKEEDEAAGTFEFRPLGCGLLDVPAVLAAAQDAGTQWVVVEQDQPSMGLTSLACVEHSLRYLHTLKK